MSRPLRLQYPGAIYHVTARGNAGQAIVRNDRGRQRFVATVATLVGQCGERIAVDWALFRIELYGGSVSPEDSSEKLSHYG